jgi:phosphatidylethanolamine-binding protein (PEBP) family uncharacterized protein
MLLDEGTQRVLPQGYEDAVHGTVRHVVGHARATYGGACPPNTPGPHCGYPIFTRHSYVPPLLAVRLA